MSTRPPLGCSVPNMVQRYLGTEYDKVKSVADNIDYVKDVAEAIKGIPVISYIGDEPPVQPLNGAEWYCTTDGRTYVWYMDVDSGQWVESSPQSVIETDPSIAHTVAVNTDNIFALWKRSASEAGLNLVVGSFEEGGVLTSSTDVLLHKESKNIYAWSGAFPKVVPAGSTPATTGGVGAGAWVDRTDVTLRGEISDQFGIISAILSTTVLEVSTGAHSVGQRVSITDRANAIFKIYDSGVVNGLDIIDAGGGNVAILEHHETYFPEYFGASGIKSQDVRPYMIALKKRLRDEGGGAFSGFFGGEYYTSLVLSGSQKEGVIFDFDNVKWLSGGVWGLLDGQLNSSSMTESSLCYGFKRSNLGELKNIIIDDVIFDGNLSGQTGHFGNSYVYSNDTLTLYNIDGGYAKFKIYDYVDSGCFSVSCKNYNIDANTIGNYKWLYDISISSGSNSVVEPSGQFLPSDVGKNLIVVGAGSYAGSGANNALLLAKIQTYISATEVLLDRNALTTVSGAQGIFGSTDAGIYLSGDGTAGVTPPLNYPDYVDANGILPTDIELNANVSNTYTGVHCLRGLKNCKIVARGSNLVVGIDNTVATSIDGYPVFNTIVENDFTNIAYTPMFSEFNFNSIYSNNRAINCWIGPIFSGACDCIVSENSFIGMFGETPLGNNAGITLISSTRGSVNYLSKNNLISNNSIKGFWNGVIDTGEWNEFNDNHITYVRNSPTSVNGIYNISSNKYKIDGLWVVPDYSSLISPPIPQSRGVRCKVAGIIGTYIYEPGLGWAPYGRNSGSVSINSNSITITHNLGVLPVSATIIPTFDPMGAYSWWLDLGASNSTQMTIRFSQVMNGNIKWTAFI